MKAIILAGGLGKRLHPITLEIPKPLVPVKKKPIVNHLIDLFARYNISEVALLVSRVHENDFARWRYHWEDELSPKKISIFHEEKPSGTFGSVKYLRDWIDNEKFILSNGDELKDFDLSQLESFHKTYKPVATIALVKVANPSEYGVPVLDGVHIREFLEKPENPPSNFINSGLYILEPEIFNHADLSKDFLMIEKDIFPKLAKEGKLVGCKLENGRWFDCGNLERWEKAMKEW